MRIVILITGKKNAGKTYTANKIKEFCNSLSNCSVEIIPFAKPIKIIAETILEISHKESEMYKRYPELYPIVIKNTSHTTTMRKIQQKLGDVIRSLFGQDFYAKEFVRQAKLSKADIVVADDWRFFIEYETVEKELSPILNNNLFLLNVIWNGDNEDKHISEIEMDKFPKVFGKRLLRINNINRRPDILEQVKNILSANLFL